MEKISYNRDLPVEGGWDVIVCGSGPAGICAAVSAARQGEKTLLLERYGALGGNLTLGNVTTVMGDISSGGLSKEIDSLLNSPDSGTGIDRESAKLRLTRLVSDAGVAFRLQAPVIDVIHDEKMIRGLVVQTPEGPVCLQGKVYVDATGDGYVAAMAGAEVMYGRDGDGLVQPVSMMYTIDGINPENTLTCCHEEHTTVMKNGVEYLQLCKDAEREGRLPKNVSIVRLYHTNVPGERLVNATQFNGCRTLKAEDIAQAETVLQQQLVQVNEFLRREVPGFEHLRVRASADTLGIRESRRIRGLYELTAEDLIAGRRFDDAVVNGANFCIDIHNPSGGGQAEMEGCPHQAQPYDIPMRALQPSGVENLVLSGRCISGSHRAHASYRVMNIAMAIGQAAGCMASEAADRHCRVSELEPQAVRQRLVRQGCTLRSEN